MKPKTYVPKVGSNVKFIREPLPLHVTRDKEYTIHNDSDQEDFYIILDNGRHLHFVKLFSNAWEVVE